MRDLDRPGGARKDTLPMDRIPEGTTLAAEAAASAAPSLDELAREGARRMLQAALAIEVAGYVQRHASARDERGWAEVTRNGHARLRQVTLGAGAVEVEAPRV